MALRRKFHEKTPEEKESLILLLFSMLAADGEVKTEEREFLWKKAIELGYSKEDLKNIIDGADEEKLDHLVIPESKHDRIEIIVDLVSMMMIDEDINSNELDFVYYVTAKIGYKKELVDFMMLVAKQARDKKNITPDQIIPYLIQRMEDNGVL